MVEDLVDCPRTKSARAIVPRGPNGSLREPTVSGTIPMNRMLHRVEIMLLPGLNLGWKTLLLAVVMGMFAFGAVRGVPCYGQILHANGPRPSFEVASIRPSPPDEEGRNFIGPGGHADSFRVRGVTIKKLISYAYGLGYDGELSGGPKWIGTDRFDIEAKPDEAEVAALGKLSRDDRDEQMRLMLQSLLAERFDLKVSSAKRELPMYTLVVAKGGLKCTKEAPDSPLAATLPPRFRGSAAPPPPPPPPGYTPPMPDEARPAQPLHMRTKGWPFWLVVTSLSHQPELGGRTVVDKTGLDGSYDCEASWSRDGSEGSGPSFFTAIQEQMGLKLQPEKGLVEVLSIDHVEQPSQN